MMACSNIPQDRYENAIFDGDWWETLVEGKF